MGSNNGNIKPTQKTLSLQPCLCMQHTVFFHSVAKINVNVAAHKAAPVEIKYNAIRLNLPRAEHSRSHQQEYKLC